MRHKSATLLIVMTLLLSGVLIVPGCSDGVDGVLGEKEIEYIDEAIGLRIPDGATKVWMLITVESNMVMLNMRVDIPASELADIRRSWALEGAEELDWQLLSPPPETRLGTDWWQTHDRRPPAGEGAEWRYFRLQPKPRYGAPASMAIVTAGEAATVYFYRGADIDMYPGGFLDFMSEYRLPGDRWFPNRGQTYGGLWVLEERH